MKINQAETPRVPDPISVDALRRHPGFDEAKMILADNLARLYGDDPRLRHLIEYETGVTFMLIVSLHAARNPDDPADVLSMQKLDAILPMMGIAPSRRVRDLVNRLRRDGLVEAYPDPADGRARLMRATQRGLEADSAWLATFHAPLAYLYPKRDYAAAMNRDPAYQRAFRIAGLHTLDIANTIMSANPPMDYFVRETVGFRILMLLLLSARGDPDHRSGAGFYSTAAERGGVSRTHVRNVLQGAADRDLLALSDPPGSYVEILPEMSASFDRWVAESLSTMDLVSMASRRLL